VTKHGAQELGEAPSLTVRSTISITFSFLYLFVASGLLGAAFGLTAALLLKASPSIHVHQVSDLISGHAHQVGRSPAECVQYGWQLLSTNGIGLCYNPRNSSNIALALSD